MLARCAATMPGADGVSVSRVPGRPPDSKRGLGIKVPLLLCFCIDLSRTLATLTETLFGTVYTLHSRFMYCCVPVRPRLRHICHAAVIVHHRLAVNDRLLASGTPSSPKQLCNLKHQSSPLRYLLYRVLSPLGPYVVGTWKARAMSQLQNFLMKPQPKAHTKRRQQLVCACVYIYIYI